MTRDERERINKFIHETVMGNDRCICPTECDCEDEARGLVSNECPIHNIAPQPVEGCSFHDGDWRRDIPDYTSESSPRSLLDEAEKKCIEEVGKVAYCRKVMESNGFNPKDLYALYEQVITASAEQRCLAIEAAWRTK